jgi:hypothetical protein
MEGFEKSFKLKTPEMIQAQIEAFADGGVREFSDEQREILENSSELAKITDPDNLPDNLSVELRELIESNREVYLQFLRERKNEIERIEKSISLYNEKFKSAVACLKQRLDSGDKKDLPEYLGSGANGSAYRIFVDGKAYAAKFANSVTQSNFEIKPLIKASGINHTSQFVCHSFEDGVVIMELLPGSNVTDFTPEDVPYYTDEHIEQLIDTIVELDNAGLVIDPKPSNFLYDENEGFSVLDYHIKRDGARYGLAQSLIDLRLALTARKRERLDYNAPDYQEKAAHQSLEHYKLLLPTMVRLIRIIKTKYPHLLEEWKQKYNEDLENPDVTPSDPLGKKYLPDDAELENYINTLEELGFKT